MTFTNSGGDELTDCMVATPLPAGLALARTAGNTSCQITGTTEVAVSASSYTVTAVNASGAGMADISITVTDIPSTMPTLADAEPVSVSVGAGVSVIFTNAGDGGLTACTVDPALPLGLTASVSADASTCRITGTAEGMATTDTYTVTAANVAGSGAAAVDITVSTTALAAPVLLNAPGQTVIVGSGISVAFANAGGGELMDCTVDTPLPTGLAIYLMADNTSCRITGTTELVSAGETYAVTAVNVSGSSRADISITVTDVPPAMPDLANVEAVSVSVGAGVSVIFTNAGGGGLTACTVDPALPQGLAASVSADASTCRITGTSEAVLATNTYTVTATNTAGTDMASVDITIATTPLARPDLANATALDFTLGNHCLFQLQQRRWW